MAQLPPKLPDIRTHVRDTQSPKKKFIEDRQKKEHSPLPPISKNKHTIRKSSLLNTRRTVQASGLTSIKNTLRENSDKFLTHLYQADNYDFRDGILTSDNIRHIKQLLKDMDIGTYIISKLPEQSNVQVYVKTSNQTIEFGTVNYIPIGYSNHTLIYQKLGDSAYQSR